MSADAELSTEQSILNTLFHHNLWANLHLFDTCLTLDNAQLEHSDPGTYGSIHSTLSHLVRSEERYLFFLTSQETTDAQRRDARPPIAELKERIHQSGQTLIQVAGSIQPNTQVQVGEGEKAELIPATIVLLQTIQHSNEHRTHVATMLGQLGITPPPFSGWDFYDEEILGSKSSGTG